MKKRRDGNGQSVDYCSFDGRGLYIGSHRAAAAEERKEDQGGDCVGSCLIGIVCSYALFSFCNDPCRIVGHGIGRAYGGKTILCGKKRKDKRCV